MRICNFGSLNIDLVYRVPHIARPGETLASTATRTFAGGKGANQSVALARAGADITHAGAVGTDGRWLIDKLSDHGVDATLVAVLDDRRTGHAIIQIDDEGENAIVLEAGANHAIERTRIDAALDRFAAGDVLLLQNEINDIPALIEAGRERGMRVCFNPAPMSEAVRSYPLHAVDVLIVNETEAQALAGERDPEAAARALHRQGEGRREIVVTLGARGALHLSEAGLARVEGEPVEAVDTTAAGDTFIGYYLAGRAEGQAVDAALTWACRAAALCCTKAGAMDAIPARDEVASVRA